MTVERKGKSLRQRTTGSKRRVLSQYGLPGAGGRWFGEGRSWFVCTDDGQLATQPHHSPAIPPSLHHPLPSPTRHSSAIPSHPHRRQVKHDLGDVGEGETVIVTLADKSLLDEAGNVREGEEDELENTLIVSGWFLRLEAVHCTRMIS